MMYAFLPQQSIAGKDTVGSTKGKHYVREKMIYEGLQRRLARDECEHRLMKDLLPRRSRKSKIAEKKRYDSPFGHDLAKTSRQLFPGLL